MAGGEFEYLTVEDILTLHETIVHSDDSTEPGVHSRGDIQYTISTVGEGHFGEGPDTVHENAAQYLRLLTANHPFVDGNKRTALVSTVAFYALNGYSLDYGSEIRLLLKQLAIDESTVPLWDIVEYLAANTAELPPETQVRYEKFLSIASGHTLRRNDYTDEESSNVDDGNRRD